MSSFLIFILIAVSVTVIPVLVAAKLLDIESATFKLCLYAVILSVVAEKIADNFIVNPGFSAVAVILITAFFYAGILDTKYSKGVILSMLAIGIQYGISMALVGLGISLNFVEVTT